ncbi:hypothetical protein BIY23_00140 [Wolbachia pipientis]|uniref:Uncharacterized protein n=1 Tax=Wolbachia pipientis TaxID=955 RepID=A0A1E7QKH7_WOLPI|nr:hypothetical protein [Wolbachia pipientis]OEY86907.1 hypothetical protein BIY23_00140 [Wolbachia pipientis]
MKNNAKINIVNWEVIKNCEYTENYLSKITTLYVIKIYKPEIRTILVRIGITSENIFLNKAIVIDIMEDIFPYKFNSKKKSNISRLKDLYTYLCSIVNKSIPGEMLESLTNEYKDSVNLLKAMT